MKRVVITKEELQHRYEVLGLSQRKIAAELGCTQGAISYWFKRFGISRLPLTGRRNAFFGKHHSAHTKALIGKANSEKTGALHHNWKGGTKTRPDGYVRNSKDDSYVHRSIMESILGRKLSSTEHVHHKDGNPSNNAPSNLELITNCEHSRLHAATRKRDSNKRFCK